MTDPRGRRPDVDAALIDAFGSEWCRGEPRQTVADVTFLIHASTYDGSVTIDDAARLGAPAAPTGWYEVETLRALSEAERGPSLQHYMAALADSLGPQAVLPIRWDHLFPLEQLGLVRGTRRTARLLMLRRRRPIAEAVTALLDDAWDEWRAMEDGERHARLHALLYATSRAMADARAYADALGMRQGSLVFELRRAGIADYGARLANLLGVQGAIGPEDEHFQEGEEIGQVEAEIVLDFVAQTQDLAEGAATLS